ncbi:MAG: type II toxin-antitoxin system Phd/YefM family antitoxin [Proteobacteria bacterium]|nr:type II toxin-antitoxin system Phd/YefM family antitoxin [Pseudomonadota bacterium]
MDISVTISDVKNRLSEIANQVAYGKDRIIVTRKGKSLMALVPLEDIETIKQLENRFDLEEARKILADDQESVPWEEVKKQLNL